jgi:uncharacterized protein involved in response to NO
MLGALTLLFGGNTLVHLDAISVASTAELGNRVGAATLLMLISFVGGRIIPSFTRNWLTKSRSQVAAPATFDAIDRTALAITALALAAWAYDPPWAIACWLELLAGVAVSLRLVRWRGHTTFREPLLLLLAANGFVPMLPPTTALHALTVGAIGTMTLAVMSRATLGHAGRPLVAGRGTTTIYALITVATVLRLIAPLGAPTTCCC